jgi:hypothetical protein
MVRLNSQAEADLATFEARCRAWPLVRECHMLNGEIDFILKCVAPDLSSFQSFLTEQLLKAEHVANVKTSLVIRCAKDEPGLPFRRAGGPAGEVGLARGVRQRAGRGLQAHRETLLARIQLARGVLPSSGGVAWQRGHRTLRPRLPGPTRSSGAWFHLDHHGFPDAKLVSACNRAGRMRRRLGKSHAAISAFSCLIVPSIKALLSK